MQAQRQGKAVTWGKVQAYPFPSLDWKLGRRVQTGNEASHGGAALPGADLACSVPDLASISHTGIGISPAPTICIPKSVLPAPHSEVGGAPRSERISTLRARPDGAAGSGSLSAESNGAHPAGARDKEEGATHPVAGATPHAGAASCPPFDVWCAQKQEFTNFLAKARAEVEELLTSARGFRREAQCVNSEKPRVSTLAAGSGGCPATDSDSGLVSVHEASSQHPTAMSAVPEWSRGWTLNPLREGARVQAPVAQLCRRTRT